MIRPLTQVTSLLEQLVGDLRLAAFDDATAYDGRVISAARSQVESARLMIAALLEHRHAEQIEELARSCRCEHDQGEHLVDAPHACDAVDVETGDDGAERHAPCPCRGFELAPVGLCIVAPTRSIAPLDVSPVVSRFTP